MNNKISVQELKALAKKCDTPHRLSQVDASATVENPLCGDQLLLELQLIDNRITEVGYEVNACLLCAAATGLLVDLVLGSNSEEIEEISNNVKKMLKGEGRSIDQKLDIFHSVSNHTSRHGCVMLPFRAVKSALESYGP